MSAATGSGEAGQPRRRFLVEVRGIVEIEAATPEEANRLAEQWVVAVGSGFAGEEVKPGLRLRVRYLRTEPPSDNLPGWRSS